MIQNLLKRIKRKAAYLISGVSPDTEIPLHSRREMLAFYRQFVSRGDLCFDVGANVGNRTEIFLQLGARVVSIEPQPACVKVLNSKYHRHPNLTIVPKGLADHEGVMSLLVNESANTISTFSRKWQTGRFAEYRWESTIDVPVTTLDSLIHEFGIPAFCKIDVEGFENEVLRGLSSPIAVLSFEFTKEFLEDARANVEYLLSLGAFSFNYTLGETPALAAQWTDAPTVFASLSKVDDVSLWGDIYAKMGAC